VDGAIRHPNVGEAWEYSVTISIRNDKGEEVSRQVVGVGALQPGDGRSFTFSVVAVSLNKTNIPAWGSDTLPAGSADSSRTNGA